MPWADDFLDELQTATGVSADELVEVTQQADPGYARELARRQEQEALQRGRALLLAHLDDEQRRSYEDRQRFFVTSSAGRRYCIHLGREHNVFSVDTQGRHTDTFCVHVRDRVPNEDNVLAQMLLLQSDEPAFLRIARRS